MTALVTKLKKALESIAGYVENKKPQTLAEANHMLALISVIASETLSETAIKKLPSAYAHIPVGSRLCSQPGI